MFVEHIEFAYLVMPRGIQTRRIILGPVDYALLERGIKLAPVDRRGLSAHRIYHLQCDRALLDANLHPSQIGRRIDRLFDRIKTACPGTVKAQAPKTLLFAGCQELFSNIAKEHIPVMLSIAKDIRQPQNLHLLDEALHHRRRRLGHGKRPHLHAFEAFLLRAKLLGGIYLDLHRPSGFLSDLLRHELHSLVNGMVHVEPVGKFEHLDARIVLAAPRKGHKGHTKNRQIRDTAKSLHDATFRKNSRYI